MNRCKICDTEIKEGDICGYCSVASQIFTNSMNKKQAKKTAKEIASAILLSNHIGEMLEEQGYTYDDAQKIISEYKEIAHQLAKVDRK